ncbi:Aldehyde dehydrogenase dimeric NADP-preferring [Zalerion maritima]|uniref:Aldehyde dehydrogenase dimeric NADP-preferring n=1 Tax=Zalerion maritima TaxID=339359 RepID=A0AAD5RQ81_9PEZI|nr:Aldehyde dehydrogenase dimeric NADP-preferring [Zalerion maritima]
MSSDVQALGRLRASVVDGRTESIRYRQAQLQDLHKNIREAATGLLSALQEDGSTPEEASVEVVLAQDTVRHAYDSLHFHKELKDEYSITEGKNYVNRRAGYGLVVIRPTRHTRLYSVLAPLSAAVAAGNCTVIELPQTTLHVDTLLRTILTSALDVSTFAVVTSTVPSDVLESALLVDQTSPTLSSTPTVTNLLASPSKSRVVAVVDRTADVDAAAKAISAARFSFGGASPYAPDLVLVNEYVKDAFFEASTRCATTAFARSKKTIASNESEATRKAVKEAEDKKLAQGFGGDVFRVVEVKDKASALATMKVSGRYLPIAACSSLVDAIFNYDLGTPLLAAYFFAAPGAAKYLAQHLPSQLACVNHIPTHLLVGPPAPAAKDPDFHYRYNKDMFSISRPQLVSASPSHCAETTSSCTSSTSAVSQDSVHAFACAAALLIPDGKELEKNKKLAVTLMAKAPPPMNVPGNHYLGFFEQGIVIGLSIIASIVLPTVGYTTWITGRKGFDMAMKLRSS